MSIKSIGQVEVFVGNLGEEYDVGHAATYNSTTECLTIFLDKLPLRILENQAYSVEAEVMNRGRPACCGRRKKFIVLTFNFGSELSSMQKALIAARF